jgi:hypothetical protein
MRCRRWSRSCRIEAGSCQPPAWVKLFKISKIFDNPFKL